MENCKVVYDAICRLGCARLEKFVEECRAACKMSRRTVSRAIRELTTDYMIVAGSKVWRPTSAMPKALGQPAELGQLGHDRIALLPGTQNPRGSGVVDHGWPEKINQAVVEIGEAA